MRRISILGLMLCTCLVSVAWAQQRTGTPHMGRRSIPLHGTFKVIPDSTSTTSNGSISTQAATAQKIKVYDLGHYPGGRWAEPRGINDFGVVVGFGDIASGYTRPIGDPLLGPNAEQWFDLGTLGGDRTDTEVMCMGIADTGMIVGHAAITGNEIVHAFAWTPKSGMVDIGTLADPGYNFSLAVNVNKLGALIVGWSSSEFMGQDSLPVVWTPKVVRTSGGPTVTWNIQKLDTEGFEQASGWTATGVNDFGQIIGWAWDSSLVSDTTPYGAEIAVLWNPLPWGKGWKIMKLPVSPDYPHAWPNDINDRSEIVGGVASPDWGTGVPALWRKESPWGKTWNLTALRTLGPVWDEASGINDLGDIVGVTYDANWNRSAARWSTSDPNSAQLLGFPGTWSFALRVNDNRIAVGAYGSDSIWENVAAVQIRGEPHEK